MFHIKNFELEHFYFSIHTEHEIIHVTLFDTMYNNSNSRTEILLILADQSRYDSANIGRWRFHTVGKVIKWNFLN